MRGSVPRHLLFWWVLMLIAVANGVLRVATYGQVLPELAAHQLSTVTAILFTGIAVGWFARRWPLASAQQALWVGLAWLLFTLLFEFGFGHYVAGHSWTRLLADYNLLQGRVWLLLLLWIALMPSIFYAVGKRQL